MRKFVVKMKIILWYIQHNSASTYNMFGKMVKFSLKNDLCGTLLITFDLRLLLFAKCIFLHIYYTSFQNNTFCVRLCSFIRSLAASFVAAAFFQTYIRNIFDYHGMRIVWDAFARKSNLLNQIFFDIVLT